MRTSISVVFCALVCTIGSNAGAETRNYEAPGNLESTYDIGCPDASKLSNKYTPADLYRAVSKCAEQGAHKEGAFLFALAGVYGRYDTFRVADATAHQAVTVLLMQAFARLSKEKKIALKDGIKNALGNAEGRAAMCKDVVRIGPPNYYPRYMIQHGMDAFLKKGPSDGLVKDFDAEAAWQKSLDTYLHCPRA